MVAFLLFLVILWIALGIIGAVVKGLFWLLVIAVVLFIAHRLLRWHPGARPLTPDPTAVTPAMTQAAGGAGSRNSSTTRSSSAPAPER